MMSILDSAEVEQILDKVPHLAQHWIYPETARQQKIHYVPTSAPFGLDLREAARIIGVNRQFGNQHHGI
jgi:hypothetical protein